MTPYVTFTTHVARTVVAKVVNMTGVNLLHCSLLLICQALLCHTKSYCSETSPGLGEGRGEIPREPR